MFGYWIRWSLSAKWHAASNYYSDALRGYWRIFPIVSFLQKGAQVAPQRNLQVPEKGSVEATTKGVSNKSLSRSCSDI